MLHELEPGFLRLTFELPLGIDHVHCYLARGGDARWTAFDTGLALPHIRDGWRDAIASLDGPVARVVVTHMHPDHVGASRIVQELTGATVYQGRDDHAQAVAVWNGARPPGRGVAHLRRHGMPEDLLEAVQRELDRVDGIVGLAADVELLDPGDRIDGWEAVHMPGHADGHLAFFRDGAMVAGDVLLGEITPNVGLWHDSRPDPLDDFISSLEQVVRRAPRVAFPGHGPVLDDPAARAREILAHHDERLELVLEALDGTPQTAYEVSLALFSDDLSPALRRFALVESLAHLEYLARRAHIARDSHDFVRYSRN
jgi:glyoxylase-like metal-dependent hydrolase (beta-lactamase superfamily II)